SNAFPIGRANNVIRREGLTATATEAFTKVEVSPSLSPSADDIGYEIEVLVETGTETCPETTDIVTTT
ncbi:hypothetical protein HDU99_006612, partial [Rhizoclosmatium hyalinum]